MPDFEAVPGVDDLRRHAEAVLFSVGAPMQKRSLADALDVDRATLDGVLEALDDALEDRGLMLQRHLDMVQLVTRPETSEAVRRILNPEVTGRLSPAAYETLAVIAYRQPVTKAAIDDVRGVDSERVIEGLITRGLIEERGRLEAPGTPRTFGTTIRFLQILGASRLEDLPGLAPEPGAPAHDEDDDRQ
ncbi:MAG: segregation and condensation protein [Chloroflexota bacterium]|jgi:segregation and condensation protein B|nr:segregation and condensation protein [Chloroflexota bacterium]